jgi:hypothetical protein
MLLIKLPIDAQSARLMAGSRVWFECTGCHWIANLFAAFPPFTRALKIRGIDATDREGKRLPRYEEQSAMHDDIDGAIAEAEQLAKSIARRT